MPNDTAALSRLLDEAAIRDLTARFADAVMSPDPDRFRALWSEDARWVLGGTEGQPLEQRATGVDEVVALLGSLWDGNDHFVHFAVQGPIEVDGDEASATCVCHEAARGPGRYYRTHGVWTDRLRRTDRGWVFTSRSYRYLWLDTSPYTGDTFPTQRPRRKPRAV